MANLTFKTPDGDFCYGCLAHNRDKFFCEFFKEFLKNRFGYPSDNKCNRCKELGKHGTAKQINVR